MNFRVKLANPNGTLSLRMTGLGTTELELEAGTSISISIAAAALNESKVRQGGYA